MPSLHASLPHSPVTPAALARARWSARSLFLALGVIAGNWGAHIPSVAAAYGLREATLAWVLLAAAVGSVSSLFFAGRAVATLGVRRTALLAGLLMCGVLAAVLHLPGLPVLLPVMVLFGAGISLLDVAINAEGSELEQVGGRNIMSNLHGMFSLGGMLGAGWAAWMLSLGLAPGMQLPLAGMAVAVLVAVAARGMLAVHATAAASGDAPTAKFVWPRGLLLVLGLLIFCGMTAEGVMYDWGVLYLKQEIGMPQAQAALGYAAFAGAMAVARFCGDTLRERYSEVGLLRVSAWLSTLAMAVVLLSANPWVALVGFALVGAGLAPVAPILFNAATRVPGVSRAAAIAAVTSIGYSGFMVGPPLIGAIATQTSLAWALSVVVVVSALLALGARYVPQKAQ